ncbi:hypothetical protein [Micromonospora sp. WMMD975]|uniref:hypothetical protein n=1 Tax=Micromonospora sp. WMMD975 TaxID=3016087 RepID=UPI00249B0652|nr:hypothetical protein [Micromonospora sp. WMMD975]WFE32641.1 hypothetical protein O7613_24250 [Micromonospora sp. WMMD975]
MVTVSHKLQAGEHPVQQFPARFDAHGLFRSRFRVDGAAPAGSRRSSRAVVVSYGFTDEIGNATRPAFQNVHFRRGGLGWLVDVVLASRREQLIGGADQPHVNATDGRGIDESGHTEAAVSEPAGPHRRIRFVSSKPDEARDFIGRMYGAHLQFDEAGSGGIWVSLNRAEFGAVSSTTARISADLDFLVEGRDELFLNTVISGRVDYTCGRRDASYHAGDIFIGSHPQMAWRGRLFSPDVDVIGLPETLLREVAGTAGERSNGRWLPRSWEPLPGCAEQWRATTRYVRDLLDQPPAATEPLVLGAAARLLAATALAAFPSDGRPEPSIEDRHDAHRKTLRRAITLIEANPDADLSVAGIAHAAGGDRKRAAARLPSVPRHHPHGLSGTGPSRPGPGRPAQGHGR